MVLVSQIFFIKALVASGATVSIINSNVFNKLTEFIKRRKSCGSPKLTSITGHNLDVKGSINPTVEKDNIKIFPLAS